MRGMHLVFAVFAVIGSAAAIACSSSTAATPKGNDEVGNGDQNSPAPSNDTPAPSNSSGSATNDEGGTDNGDGGDGGGVNNGDGGAKCTAGSIAETESNDTEATANAIPAATGSYCGSLATASDVDFATFVLPSDATQIGFSTEYTRMGVAIDIVVDGETFDLSAPPFKPGKKYLFKVHTTGDAPVDYRLDVTIKK